MALQTFGTLRPSAPRLAPGILRRDWILPSGFGVAGLVVTYAWSWNPSFWGDEAASVMSAERPLPTLFAMLWHIDAVHGLYYLFLHFWIDAFGATPASVRLPSAIAVGIAVAGTVVLARLMASRRVAVLAGIVCIVLPRMNYMGGEARSYAMNTALAVWVTILLLVLVQRRVTDRRAWAAYAVVLAAGVYLFLYLALLAVVHGAYVWVATRTPAAPVPAAPVPAAPVPAAPTLAAPTPVAVHPPTVRRRWLLATLAAVVVCLPIAVFGVAQSHQIAFLATRNSATASLILVDQWFGNAALAILCWALIVTALVAAVVVWRRSRTRSPLTLLAALWLIVPSGLLLIGNDFVTPMYSNRYLSFSTPAAALLIALGLSALGKRWVGVVGVTAVVALAAPTLVQQRGPYAKDGGSDWAQVSHLIGASARPGEAIVFDNSTRPSRRPRLAMRLYPQDYRGLADVELVTPFAQTPSLWDVTAPLTRVAEKLATTPTVWLLELHGSSDNLSGTDVAELEHLGFTQVTVTTVNRTEIYRMSRTTND